MRLIQTLIAVALLGLLTVQAQAQGANAAIRVNDAVITQYELDQRIRLLEIFRTPGDLQATAREQLIDDVLKNALINQTGLRLTEEALERELESFAGRANLPLDQFLGVLAQNGVDRGTLENFVRIGVTWRDYIRTRFRSQAEITDAEIDRAIGLSSGNAEGIEVLLSEIIIPAPPPRAAQANAQAQRISQLTSFAAFEAQARQVSALPSRVNGGRLGWLPISNYPPQLRAIILSLAPGEVTAPIQIPNGVALFQMRDVREVATAAPVPTAIEYAAYYIGGSNPLATAQAVSERVDTCDDLYGEAQGQSPTVLERDTLDPAAIPQDVALELARLDTGETSINLTRADGATRVLLMLCGRSFGEDGPQDRDSVRERLRSQRLAGFAGALLADERASASING